MAKRVPLNPLYYGDNLEVLRLHTKDDSVDLVYLDPPFKSDQNYNVLFANQDGSRAAAQIHAFEDTWEWDRAAVDAYEETVEAGGAVADVMRAFRTFLGDNAMMAYLAMMAPRLTELRRVMKDTATIYLHCDPVASHYLKLLMDAVFGPTSFRNEIIWQRTLSKGLMTQKLPSNHDVLLVYQKGDRPTWNEDSIFRAYNPEDLDDKTDEKYSQRDPDGRRFQLTSLINPNQDRPNLTYEFLGVTRVWRWTKERMQREYDRDRVVQTAKGRVPRLKRYLDEQRGKPLGDVWTDIPPINARAQERLGYPTQKPEELLERILLMSSNEGDVVLDPFCGCGTTIAVAQRLKRRWIGIDVTHLAINLMKYRLRDAFGDDVVKEYQVVGEPADLAGAAQLKDEDPYQFQFWALGLVNARPIEEKRGRDKGIDGRLYFHDERGAGATTKQIVFSVKAGKTGPQHVRDLVGVMSRESAEMGVLIAMQKPTKDMRSEAASAGSYQTPQGAKYPTVQIITIDELLEGGRIDCPPTEHGTFKRAPRSRQPTSKGRTLFDVEPDDEGGVDEGPPF